jgi:hypothetical protein
MEKMLNMSMAREILEEANIMEIIELVAKLILKIMN